MRDDVWMPDWVKEQADARPGRSGYVPKHVLIRDYAEALARRGEAVTYAKVRAMLEAVGRGYSTRHSGEIYEGLRTLKRRGVIGLYPTGRRVQVGDRTYRSIREAAKAERCRASTVRARIEAGMPGWSFVD
jgi:hypothetical protein